jgi:hypothetical protein
MGNNENVLQFALIANLVFRSAKDDYKRFATGLSNNSHGTIQKRFVS